MSSTPTTGTSPTTTVYARRLRKAHREQVCRCKVGSCTICGSKCRRCMCACDGVEPAEALARSRGGYRRLANALSKERKQRKEVEVKKATTSTKASTRSTRNTTKASRESRSDTKQSSRSTRSTTCTKPSSTSTRSKKRKANSHFHKVGKICTGAEIEKRKKSRFKLDTDSDTESKADSDSEYIDKVDEENGTKDTNPTTTRDQQTQDDLEFRMFIEDDSMSGISDAIEEYENKKSLKKLTIAERIRRSRLPSSTYTRNKDDNNGVAIVSTTTKPSSEKDKVTKTSELEDLLSQFNLPHHWIRVIPSFKIRESESDIRASSSKASFGRLVSLCTRLIETSLKTICPGPGYEEFKSYLLSKIIQKNHKSHETQTEDPKIHQYVRTDSEKVESVISCLCKWSNKSKKRSIERRVIRAILNEVFLTHEIKDMKKKHNLKQGNGQPVAQARSDAITLSQGKQLKLKTITRQCKLDSTIFKCVDFILSENNVSSVSWGVKSVLVQSSGELTLPKLTRKTPIYNMYLNYKELVNNDNEKLKFTTFYYICRMLTSNDESMLSSIDYVTGLLVNETSETMQDIIDSLLTNSQDRSEFTKMISSAKNFLKNQFKDQVVKDDDCSFHGLDYALSCDMPQRSNIDDNASKFPFYVCERLKSIIISTSTNNDDTSTTDADRTNAHRDARVGDAMNVIDGISEKFKLYMAHQARCKCQSMAISKLEDDIKNICVQSNGKLVKALIIMDFKMKYEMKSNRETTVEHFGKRGIGWHGFAVIFYLLDEDKNPYKNIVYLDQILSDTNKQDGPTVVALLEIAICTIIHELPFIKEAIITSDNATSYQNHLLTFMMAIFNQKFNNEFFISDFVHTETQDGKSLLDAHFATSNRHLINFMKTWRDNRVTRINTSKGLAYALSFGQGMKNTIVLLVEFNRTKLDDLKILFNKMITQCGEYYNRANHIKFNKASNEMWSKHSTSTDDYFEVIKKCVFDFEVYAYSNIKPSVKFHLNMSEEKLTIDQETKDRINLIFETNISDETPNVSSTDNSTPPPLNDSPRHVETTSDVGDFSSYHRHRKSSLIQSLESVGAFSSVGISPQNLEVELVDCNTSDSDSDSDFDIDEHMSDMEDDDHHLNDYFLSTNDYQKYGQPPQISFARDLMLTDTNVISWLPLGTIRKKKNETERRKKVYKMPMAKGVVDTAVTYANETIIQNHLFQHRTDLDPLFTCASNFNMDPFESGWAKRKSRGNMYGTSYKHLYEKELVEMFESGVVNSSNKMSAGKMRENLITLYPDRFSIPGETEIRQFIGKLSQISKKKQTSSEKKSNRGRKSDANKPSWYARLEQIIENNPTEKPQAIFNSLIQSFNNDLPDDLPMEEGTGAIDRDKIKSTIARFKTNIKKNAKRSIIV